MISPKLPLLEGQARAQCAVYASDNLALPLENNRIATQEATKPRGSNRIHDGAEKSYQRKQHTEDRELCDDVAVFWPDELRKERQEEQCSFRVQDFSQNCLSKRLRCGDGDASLAKVDRNLLQERFYAEVTR